MKSGTTESITEVETDLLTTVIGGDQTAEIKAKLDAEQMEADARLERCYTWAKLGNRSGNFYEQPDVRKLKCDADYGNWFFPRKVQGVPG